MIKYIFKFSFILNYFVLIQVVQLNPIPIHKECLYYKSHYCYLVFCMFLVMYMYFLEYMDFALHLMELLNYLDQMAQAILRFLLSLRLLSLVCFLSLIFHLQLSRYHFFYNIVSFILQDSFMNHQIQFHVILSLLS